MEVDGDVDEDETRAALEEYKIWKRNTPFLYDLVISHALEWPSLTVEWLPNFRAPSGADYTVHQLLLGTHTSENEPNYLMLADVMLPSSDHPENGKFSAARSKVQIVQMINHDGEVNRARCMPQMPNITATKTVPAEVYVFDLKRHPSKAPLNGGCNPEFKLRGHTKEGYGLAWSPLKSGYLLSGSDDQQICVWDINAGNYERKVIDTYRKFRAHKAVVEDVAWHPTLEHVFGSTGDDSKLNIWDLRDYRRAQYIQTHSAEVNTLSFNPFVDTIVATGTADDNIAIFDTRYSAGPLCKIAKHKKGVFRVEWSPSYPNILSSCGADRRLMIWDINRVGAAQTTQEEQDGPPELLFVHSGHTSKISDSSWNPNERWVMASVAEDNVLQIWEMKEHIHSNGYA